MGRVAGRRSLSRWLRSLPLTAIERHQRATDRVSFAAASLLHLAAVALILAIPEPEPTKAVPSSEPQMPRSIVVVQVEKPEPKEVKVAIEMPKIEIPEAPPRVEEVDLARLEPTPGVVARPRPRRVVRKKRPREPRASARPAGPVTPITSPDASAAGEPEVGSAAPNARPNGVGAPEPPMVADADKDGPEVDLAELLRGYRSGVHGAFRRAYRFPRAARRAGLEGVVLIEIVIDTSGRIVHTRVARSSGHPALDRAALKTAASIRLPAPPVELGWGRRAVQIPIEYRLSRRG